MTGQVHNVGVVKRLIPHCALIISLVMPIASALIHAVNLQPTRISEVAELITIAQEQNATYPVFRYEGIVVQGDISLQDYREAIALVGSRLQPNERILGISATQQIPHQRQSSKDFIVETCAKNCDSDGEGRGFGLERVNGIMELFILYDWIG
jgi:hypothetical protein